MKLVVALVAVAACGRIDFDPVGVGSNGSHDDGGTGTGDGPPGGFKDAPVDATTACSFARVVTQGVRLATSTCLGHDLVDSCGPAATQEVVFAFTPAATAGFNIAAYEPGTSNISNSVQQMTTGCGALMGGCSALLGTSLTGGQTYYFVVEASAGGCANIEFLIQ